MYYIYAYLRKRDGSPYYVGKGKGKRSIIKRRYISVPKDRNQIVFWHENLDEEEAFNLERFYITFFGRKDQGSGILLNQTDGGEGASGTIRSEDIKRQISLKLTGLKRPPKSEEHKQKHRLSMLGRSPPNKGKTMTEEQRQKLRKPKTITTSHHSFVQHSCPNCGKEGRGNTFFRWHFDKCRK